MKIALVTQIRNESKRLEEWIDFHYRFYDFDLFQFYLDNPEDDSKEVLEKLSTKYNINYKHTNPVGEYQGNNCRVAVHRQLESFKDGFHSLKRDYDWIAIFDVDEWLVPVDITNFNLKEDLSNYEKNNLYIPMYNFVPPFNYEKSILDQNFLRWTDDERVRYKHDQCGKSFNRGKICLDDDNCSVDVHFGPDKGEFRGDLDTFSKNHKYRLHQFQFHMTHEHSNYEEYDDSIKKMILNK